VDVQATRVGIKFEAAPPHEEEKKRKRKEVERAKNLRRPVDAVRKNICSGVSRLMASLVAFMPEVCSHDLAY
jgi:hypothetical protein